MKKIITLILSAIIILCLTSCRELPEGSSSVVLSEMVVIESTIYAETPSDSSSSDVMSTSSETTPSKSEQPTINAASSEETSGSTSAPAPAPTTTSSNDTTSSSETRKVVQRADTETGISWDGVSPIIYTYPDGTTGTEPKNGATYEYLPGMYNTVENIERVEYDGICSHCGKESGDGTHGTCLRFWTSGHDCPNCGEHVEVRTCHTCDE